jgi:hypothetical protein
MSAGVISLNVRLSKSAMLRSFILKVANSR